LGGFPGSPFQFGFQFFNIFLYFPVWHSAPFARLRLEPCNMLNFMAVFQFLCRLLR
jgi:hypothetical protein